VPNDLLPENPATNFEGFLLTQEFFERIVSLLTFSAFTPAGTMYQLFVAPRATLNVRLDSRRLGLANISDVNLRRKLLVFIANWKVSPLTLQCYWVTSQPGLSWDKQKLVNSAGLLHLVLSFQTEKSYRRIIPPPFFVSMIFGT
jgi:hypothetical protein